MVLKTDGTKIYNDINGNSNVRFYSERFADKAYALAPIFVIPDTVSGKLDCYKCVYKRWRTFSEESNINARDYYMRIINYTPYPKLINLVCYLELNTAAWEGVTYKIVSYPFILAAASAVALKNPWTDRQVYWNGLAIVSIVAMPVTVPCAVSEPAESYSVSDPVNVSTIVSGTDKIQLLDIRTTGHSALADMGAARKIPYILGANDNNYQENWWYTNQYYHSSSDVDPKRVIDLTHDGYSLYQQMSSCGINGLYDLPSEQHKLFKDGQIGLPFTAHYSAAQFNGFTFQGVVGDYDSWNTRNWGKKYLKATSQYFGYNAAGGSVDPSSPNPGGGPGFYTCPSVTYDINGNIISDNIVDVWKSGTDGNFNGITVLFPLTDMNDGHLGSAYVVTEMF